MLEDRVAWSRSHITQSSTTRDQAQVYLTDCLDMHEPSPQKHAAREALMLPAYGDSPQLSSSYRSPSASYTPYGLVDVRNFVATPAQLEAEASYDRPEFNVQAQLWTSVIRDNALMSHLLTVYFTYNHKFFCWFEKESFIEDLLQGGTDFCSPLLVNAVLSLACISSHLLDVEQQSKPWVPGYLGRQFFEEARRQLFDEEGKESMTTVQALVTMAYVSCCNGRDRVGEIYYDRAFRTAQQMSLLRSPSTWSRPGPDRRNIAQKLDRVRSKTAWGMFNYQTLLQNSMLREPVIRRAPLVPSRYGHQDGRDGSIFQAHCELCMIHNHISWLFYSREDENGMHNRPPASIDQTEALYVKLQTWYDGLPTSFHDEQEYDMAELLIL
ncbi:hypothetical protein LTR50_007903 [Elasticomyces elasticus]|nr:hypothetical protein LTR50_007903 [Elasticomyces elasticus]